MTGFTSVDMQLLANYDIKNHTSTKQCEELLEHIKSFSTHKVIENGVDEKGEIETISKEKDVALEDQENTEPPLQQPISREGGTKSSIILEGVGSTKSCTELLYQLGVGQAKYQDINR